MKGRHALALVAVAAILGAAIAMSTLNRFLHEPAAISQAGIAFEILPGAAFSSVSEGLAREGIIDHPDWLRWHARYTGDASKVRAGNYRLTAGDTPADILQKFVAGQVELFSFTIIEGWNYHELLAAMLASDAIDSSMVSEDWPAVLEGFGATVQHPEGLFLPETYRFPKHTRDVDVLQQAYRHMQQLLDDEWRNRAKDLPIKTPYETLILASIIEKETAKVEERPMIAGVFIRRMQKHMRLQTDPTVIYGLGTAFDGNITRRHLRTDTPYNTYTRHGLPPTPIAMPGPAAIHAALHPAAGNELYFVATGLGDGSHKFSQTKTEHDAAVREYLARQRSRKYNRQGT